MNGEKLATGEGTREKEKSIRGSGMRFADALNRQVVLG